MSLRTWQKYSHWVSHHQTLYSVTFGRGWTSMILIGFHVTVILLLPNQTRSDGGVVVKLLTCRARGPGWSPGLITTVLEIGHLLLLSHDMTKIFLVPYLLAGGTINLLAVCPSVCLSVRLSHFSFPEFSLQSFEILTWNVVYECVLT